MLLGSDGTSCRHLFDYLAQEELINKRSGSGDQGLDLFDSLLGIMFS